MPRARGKAFPHHPNTRRRSLRRGSLPLAILSGLATQTLRISAVFFVVGTTPAPLTRRKMRWMYERLDQTADVTIDFEKMIADTRQRIRLHQTIYDLQKRRMVRRVRRKGRYYLAITEEGKRKYIRASLNAIRIEPLQSWDGRWRIVLFDIPEKNRFGRDVLRSKLRDLGFFQLQKSAFVYPYPCADTLDILIHAFDITPFVTFFETDSLGYHEKGALMHFNLRRPK